MITDNWLITQLHTHSLNLFVEEDMEEKEREDTEYTVGAARWCTAVRQMSQMQFNKYILEISLDLLDMLTLQNMWFEVKYRQSLYYIIEGIKVNRTSWMWS